VRKPRPDERWERTDGGLIVPRRPTLPTRRYIQKWGQVPCCCDVEEACNPCGEGTVDPGDFPGVWATFNLVDNAFCTSCNEFNDSYWLPMVDIGPWDCPAGYGLACAFQYGDEFDVSLCGFGPPLYIWAIISSTVHGVYVSSNQLFNCSATPNVIGFGFSSSGCVKIDTSTGVVGRCSGGVVVG
jgi:hypothetical protein